MSFLALLAGLDPPMCDDWSEVERLACDDGDLRAIDERLERLATSHVPLAARQKRMAGFLEQITRWVEPSYKPQHLPSRHAPEADECLFFGRNLPSASAPVSASSSSTGVGGAIVVSSPVAQPRTASFWEQIELGAELIDRHLEGLDNYADEDLLPLMGPAERQRRADLVLCQDKIDRLPTWLHVGVVSPDGMAPCSSRLVVSSMLLLGCFSVTLRA